MNVDSLLRVYLKADANAPEGSVRGSINNPVLPIGGPKMRYACLLLLNKEKESHA